MAWHHRYTQQRPEQRFVHVERIPVPGVSCPACDSTDIRRYPIANHLGPRMVTKCQRCFEVLALDRPAEADNWPPFRSVTYDWEASPSERAGRDLAVRTGSFDRSL
ncbi:hypothetical protein NONO_c27720 [Nocardia nova SH22a]|uniref:Uncharacterized protein n=1 Tax=Nocardia nova SH22a TaxID=1415166 RepID=W5TEH3_9NOCA|nr:hypothetical protein [Nocardia nova]AHH17564.1 hypothetical protein NONO_c27720 [Nocardia nova SH22a]